MPGAGPESAADLDEPPSALQRAWASSFGGWGKTGLRPALSCFDPPSRGADPDAQAAAGRPQDAPAPAATGRPRAPPPGAAPRTVPGPPPLQARSQERGRGPAGPLPLVRLGSGRKEKN